jgi:hypothetical protein
VTTSIVVLVIASSFTGLFSMQADYYRTLELEDLASSITDLITEVDLLACEAWLEVNWSSSAESHGLPRSFHGGPYIVQFAADRPHLVWQGTRVAGRYFPSDVVLLDGDGASVDLLEIHSTTGFTVSAEPEWSERGLEHVISVQALD